MVEDKQSAVTEITEIAEIAEIPEERIDSVLGRVSSSAPTSDQSSDQSSDQETSGGTGPLAGEAMEASAVTEIPAETLQEDPDKIPVAILTPASVALSTEVPVEVNGRADRPATEAPTLTVAIPEPPPEIGIASGTQYRQDTRYEVEGDAEVFVKTGSMGTTLLRGRILDLSSTGCFIQTMARVMIKPGTVVQLLFSIYGTSFRIDATSRYARMRVGVGFRFLEMDEPTHKRLHAVLGDIRSRLIDENQPVIDRAILE
jgi:hypothetical protein